MKISKIEIQKREREGYPGTIIFADFIIDGVSLYEEIAQTYDYVSCLGWGSKDFQLNQIERLLLRCESDFPNNRNSLFICPACADLGCGANTAKIDKQDGIVIWSLFGSQNNITDKLTINDLRTYYFEVDEYNRVIEGSLGIGSYKWPWN
ncbi:hypothetical protein H1230_06980 [Paenibacillus sp. 19GGS1-52]|uniref:hypothetical protein n=1 Tax=Paenibacillus sp. 19GGS1-52 TaxID=2758563 RepID=UPI001EFA7DD0|nr:hypothetical protein [Paenibacillus sp. 19GGS1-52]ULO08543.1 hypothetical protein H1230_06980 [Paenibacillus sp. 19GGS1-52]